MKKIFFLIVLITLSVGCFSQDPIKLAKDEAKSQIEQMEKERAAERAEIKRHTKNVEKLNKDIKHLKKVVKSIKKL